MIDLHTHILPGLDDGAPDLETSVLMAAVAAESGVTHLVAKPHSNQRGAFENYASPALQVRFDCLCTAVHEAGIPLELSLGMEIFGTGDVLQLLHDGRLLTLGGGEPQRKGHIRGNLNLRNDKRTLLTVITQLLPYVGYPRSLNAIACLNEVAPGRE